MSENCFIHPSASVETTVSIGAESEIGAGAMIDGDVIIAPGVFIGEDTDIGSGTIIGKLSFIGNNVTIGSEVKIGNRTLILDNARICQNSVQSGSSDARTLLSHASVGWGVMLHDEVELGEDAIIPTQRTIASIGNFGLKDRVVTIYGSDDGAPI